MTHFDWNSPRLWESRAPIGYRQGVLTVEELSVPEIIETASTPTYIYSTLAIETRYREFQETLGGASEDLCYALKAIGRRPDEETLRKGDLDAIPPSLSYPHPKYDSF